MHLVKRQRGGLRNTLGSWITRSHNQHSSYKQHGAVSQFRAASFWGTPRNLTWGGHVFHPLGTSRLSRCCDTFGRQKQPSRMPPELRHSTLSQRGSRMSKNTSHQVEKKDKRSFLWSQGRRSRGRFFFLWWMCVWVIILEYSSANVPCSLRLVWANSIFLITK